VETHGKHSVGSQGRMANEAEAEEREAVGISDF
jgi:hypothetical protein